MGTCKGMNCGCTDGVSHSAECRAEHAAAVAGGLFVKGDRVKVVPVEPTSQMLDAAVAFALNVGLTRDYRWSDYMRDVYVRMLAFVPTTHAREDKPC